MGVALKREHLQNAKYDYTWKRADGDGKYIGPLDRDKVSKREGYEVKDFIQNLMNKYSLKNLSDVHKIEDALHRPELRSIFNRSELISRVEQHLGLR